MNWFELLKTQYNKHHYIRKSKTHWHDIYISKLRKLIKTHNGNFDFFFIGSVNPDIVDYYRIPYIELKDIFIDQNLAPSSHGSPRWFVNFENDSIKIGDSIQNVSKFRIKQVLSNFDFSLPEEIESVNSFSEGIGKQITINSYERSSTARKQCIDHYGYNCSICNFNFEEYYGETGKNFIHVHHLVPLSKITGTYTIDPIDDLKPVCPNCHAIIHKDGVVRSMEEMKELIKSKSI